MKTKAEVEALSRPELKDYLEHLNKDELKSTLEMVDLPTLKEGLEHIDAPTLQIGLQKIDLPTLKNAIEIIDRATLKVGLEEIDRDTLRNAIQVIDKPTLAAAIKVIDAPTLSVARQVVDSATNAAISDILQNAAGQADLSDSYTFPGFPAYAIHFKDVEKVNKGRYATCTMIVNTDGQINGDFKVENMQFAAGCHIAGRIEFYDVKGNLLARTRMPRIGLPIAAFAKVVERHADFSGQIDPTQIAKLYAISFVGFEDATGGLSDAVQEVTAFFKQNAQIIIAAFSG